jgi:sugar/nucleoside kinase (ribokinase family)
MDIYAFGHVSTGRILHLKDSFPAPDGYGEVTRDLENHSGEALGSALVAHRLGLDVRLEGNWIGDNPPCRRTLEFLTNRGLDTSGLRVEPGYPGVQELVITDGETRTVFGRYCDLLFTTPQWDMPELERIQGARIAIVDPSFGAATQTVIDHTRSLSIPLVTSDAALESPLCAAATVLVISNEFLHREHPDCVAMGAAREALFLRYLERCPGLVVFTSGSGEVRFGRQTMTDSVKPRKVEVVDSAGAGDSFRGALAYALLQGWNDRRAVEFAAAVAALVCTTTPGCLHSPTLAEVQTFLATGPTVP